MVGPVDDSLIGSNKIARGLQNQADHQQETPEVLDGGHVCETDQKDIELLLMI